MNKYGVNELRKMFLDFFESKGHLVMKSFSLVPHNDNSLLLINSRHGATQALFYRTGDSAPQKVTTCQKGSVPAILKISARRTGTEPF